MTKEPITITPAAEEYIAEIIAKHPGKILRVGVDGKGCAGFQYNFELITKEELNPLDDVISRDWGKVAVDYTSAMYLLGSTLNLKEDLFSCELVWLNPQAASTCGCGKSFSPA